MTVDVTGRVPGPDHVPFAVREDARRALEYMGLTPGHADHRDPGRRRLHRLVHERADRGPAGRGPGLPGPQGRRRASAHWSSRERAGPASGRGRRAGPRSSAEAGAEWRQSGCSMCLAMNPDKLTPGQRLGQHEQPQLRGPPGARRPHPPRQPRHGRRRRRHRPFRRRPATARRQARRTQGDSS